VAEIVLERAGVVAVVGELEAAGMAQHVRMDGKRQLGGLAEPCHKMMEAHRADWFATLANKCVGGGAGPEGVASELGPLPPLKWDPKSGIS
jgi:hypothetical protein